MRRTWIDFDLATSDLSDNAFRVMVYLLLHADKKGDCWPSLRKVAHETGRSERSLDFAIRELKSKCFIESINEGRGRYRFHILKRTSATDCAGSDAEQAQKTTETSATGCASKTGTGAKNKETGAKSEVNERKKCTERAQKVSDHSHIREQGIEQGKEQGKEQFLLGAGETEESQNEDDGREPFESGLGTKLPDFRNAPPLEKPKIRYRHVQLGEIESDFKRILGLEAENKIRNISQEMVDSGFVKWALCSSEDKDEPAGYFYTLIQNSWHGGRWVNPEKVREQKFAAKAADQAREKLAEELTAARNLMEMAKREFEKGRATQADVSKYTNRFEEAKRRAEAC